jgi:FdrA protein
MLDDDPATELIMLISKPPSPGVADSVQKVISTLRTPVVTALLGQGEDLTAATETALRALDRPVPRWPHHPADAPTQPNGPDQPSERNEPSETGGPGGSVRGGLVGIYSGGTLCAEAAMIAGQGEFTDYGDDVYTRGRAHPMIDPTLRLEALRRVRPEDVVLMDVVLGHGADPDPAAGLTPVIASVPAPVVVALIGTEADPQDLRRQRAAFGRAGATVFASNAQAARHAVSLLGPVGQHVRGEDR